MTTFLFKIWKITAEYDTKIDFLSFKQKDSPIFTSHNPVRLLLILYIMSLRVNFSSIRNDLY